jgi:membrane-associated phospholipid phosphatase
MSHPQPGRGFRQRHATGMFFVALAFTDRPNLRKAGPALLVLATVTGWARIFVGVLFPTDIVAGLLLAAALVALLPTASVVCWAACQP